GRFRGPGDEAGPAALGPVPVQGTDRLRVSRGRAGPVGRRLARVAARASRRAGLVAPGPRPGRDGHPGHHLPDRFPRDLGAPAGLGRRDRNGAMNFDLSEEQIQIRDAVRELCRSEFASQAAKWDRDDAIPHTAVLRLAEMGLLGMSIPEEWGGLGYDARTVFTVIEEIARVSAALAIMIAVHNSVGAYPL